MKTGRRPHSWWLVIAGVLLTLGIFCGCLSAGAEPPQATFESIYSRATNKAGAVILYKPLSQDARHLETLLAPFILQSVDPASTQTNDANLLQTDFGATLAGATNPQPIVYFRAQTWTNTGTVCTQMLYLWLYAPSASPEALPVQGLRVTLDTNGFPVIWEVLAAPQNRQEVYVAGSLEHASLQHFGGRLPGRRFAVEPSLQLAPRLIMPAVVEDSPVVFGPMFYLEPRTRGPHAVICRCMPALATQIVQTVYYDLQPWPENALKVLEQMPKGKAIARQIEDFIQHRPAAQLRLPPPFESRTVPQRVDANK